jgi:3',5'-cyclic-nucleotide phosphodiesterase
MKNPTLRFLLNIAIYSILFFSVFVSSFNVQAQSKKHNFSVIPLGVKGGLDESNLSAYLVSAAGTDQYVCLDAGTLFSGARIAANNGLFKGTPSSFLRSDVKGYLLSHPHLDHVAGLILNSPDDTVKNIYGLPFTLKVLQENYFTWQSWANFGDAGQLPQLKKYHYVSLPLEKDTLLANTSLSVSTFPLSHATPGESTAFLLKNGSAYLLYLGDTGPDSIEHSNRLRHLWQSVAPLVKKGQLKAILIEVSYRNSQPDQQLFGHLTPRWLMKEMEVLRSFTGPEVLNGLSLVITHSKLFGEQEAQLQKELKHENSLGFRLVFPNQGDMYRF